MSEEDKLYKEVAPNLFGDGFSKKAKEKDEELKVLGSTRQPPKKTTNWKGKENQFFFQDATPMSRPPGTVVHFEATIASTTGQDHTSKEYKGTDQSSEQ